MRKIWHLLKFRLKTFLLVCLLAVPLASCRNVGKHTNLTPEDLKTQETQTSEAKISESASTPAAEEEKKDDQVTQAEAPASQAETVESQASASEEPTGSQEEETEEDKTEAESQSTEETQSAKTGDDKKVAQNGFTGEYNDFHLYKVFTPDQYMYVNNFPDLVLTKDDPKAQIHRQVRMTFLPTENMSAVMKSIKDVAKVETELPWRGGKVQVLKMQPARPEDMAKAKKKAQPTVDPNHPELQSPVQKDTKKKEEPLPDPIYLIFSSVTKTSSMAFYYTGTGIKVDDPEIQAIYENIQFNTSKLDKAVEDKLRKKN